MTKQIEDKIKTLFLGEVSKIDADKRTVTACISAEEIDRHNEIVTSKAVADAIAAFAKNPVACACHQRYLENGEPPVIGSWLTDTFKQSGKKSYMDVAFAATELAEKYWQLYRDKHMRAFSISFRALEYHEETTQKNGRVLIYDKIELTEISPVAIGANRSALSKQFGIDLDGDFEKSVNENFKALNDKLDSLQLALDEYIDKTSDRSDFGDALLAFGGQPQPIKQNAEDDIAESVQRLADKIKALAK